MDSGLVSGQVHFFGILELTHFLEHVLRNIHEHRPWAPGAGNVESLVYNRRDFFGCHHQIVVLGDRKRDASDVRLLERVRANCATPDLPCHDHHRHRVHERRGDTSYKIRGSWPRSGKRYTRPAGRSRVTVGCVGGALLVACEDVTKLRILGKRLI